VQRLSGRRWLKFTDEEAAALFSNAHRIASRYFGEGVVELLQPMQQRIARALLAGDAAEVRRIAEQAAPWATYPRVLQVDWVDGRLHIGGIVQLSDVVPQGWMPVPDAEEAAEAPAAHESAADEVESEMSEESAIATPGVNAENDAENNAENDIVEEAETVFADMPEEPLAEQRFADLMAQPAPEVLWLGMATSPIRVDLTERRTGETWPVRAGVQRMGLVASFTAAIDPNTIAAGNRLHDGLWDVNVHFGVLGLGMRRRATLTKERQPGNVLPEPVTAGSPTVAAYFTRRTSGLCLDVGLVRHPKLRIGPKPATPAKKFSRRAIRKVRRLLAHARHLRSLGGPGRGQEARLL
jgi:hypothetical protein